MLSRSLALTVIAVFLAGGASTLGKVAPAWAENGPPGVSFGLDERKFTATAERDGKRNSQDGASKVYHPSEEEIKVRLKVEKACRDMEDLAKRARDSGVQENMDGNDFYQKNCTTVGSPEVAARQVVAAMDLQMPDIGLAPRPATVDPDSVGLVGVPNYMWVGNPGIFSTVSDSANIDSWTISVSGEVAWVDWDMGDGQVVRCTGPGTPYEARFDLDPSPDCGHVYSQQGHYTVSATAHWVLQWSGGGQSGTVVTDRTSTADVVIGEALAVRRK